MLSMAGVSADCASEAMSVLLSALDNDRKESCKGASDIFEANGEVK
jgi:hypothetical protein